MPRQKLTTRTVETVKPPATGRLELWDASLPGFGLRVTDRGSKSWVLMYRYNGAKRRKTLGTFPALGLADARGAAGAILEKVERGEDPDPPPPPEPVEPPPVPREPDTVRTAVAAYMLKHATRNTRSWRETQRLFDLYVIPAMGDRPLTDIARRDVRDLLDGIADGTIGKPRRTRKDDDGPEPKPVQANRVRTLLVTWMNWLVDREVIAVNPAQGVKAVTRETARDRVLSADEARAVWKGTYHLGYPAGPLFRMLFLTAARRDEVREMQWPELDLQARVWTLPAARSKNGQAHVIPLTDAAVRELESLPRFGGPFVFTSGNGSKPYNNLIKPKRRLDELSGVDGWVIHDIRRTAASIMGEAGIPGETIARVLNHSERAIAGVTARYNRADQTEAKRKALETVANMFGGLLR